MTMTMNELTEPWDADPLAVRLSRIQDPPVSTNLLARVLSQTPVRNQRVTHRPPAALIAVAGLVALLVVLLAATPAGAFVGRAVLPPGLQQLFGLVSGAPQKLNRPGPNDCAIYPGSPNTTITTTVKNGVAITHETRTCSNGQTVSSDGFRMPEMSPQAAQQLVSFRIQTAAWLPSDLQLAAVGMLPKAPDFTTYENQAVVKYRPRGASSTATTGVLSIDERPGVPMNGPAVPSSAAQTVQINGQPAVYVQGSYESNPGQSPTWNPNADVEELSWQADGLTFLLTADGLGLSRSDLIRIAESIH